VLLQGWLQASCTQTHTDLNPALQQAALYKVDKIDRYQLGQWSETTCGVDEWEAAAAAAAAAAGV